MLRFYQLPKASGPITATGYGSSIVKQYPNRFGLLVAPPTDDPEPCLEKIKRATGFTIAQGGFATTTVYHSDPKRDPSGQS